MPNDLIGVVTDFITGLLGVIGGLVPGGLPDLPL